MSALSVAADQALIDLLDYAVLEGILPERDRIYAHNRLLALFQVKSPLQLATKPLPDQAKALPGVLEVLLDEAAARGLIDAQSQTDRDLFDTAIMGCVTPPPSQVEQRFYGLWEQDREAATDWYYQFSQATHYIRAERIARDQRWTVDSPYGEIDITINRSKPEKDPKAIAAAATQAKSGYPPCLLCAENEGYAGHLTHPARQNHRAIRLPLQNNQWYFQYSPYVYYNEHAIFFHAEHHPMRIDRHCFERLIDIVDWMPHYFVGSNADLPIVGGSILAHEHFQGGHYTFAMQKAPAEAKVHFPDFPGVSAHWVRWPLTVLRLTSESPEALIDLADQVLMAWRGYTDEEAGIRAHTGQTPHNTVTPIARRRGSAFELDLVLRNNRTDEAHPWGIFHPRAAYHAVKKENIGLIEVMGLAVLPARLSEALAKIQDMILAGADLSADPETAPHADWVNQRVLEPGAASDPEQLARQLRQAVGEIFVAVLEDAGVYKRDEAGLKARDRFVETLGARVEAIQ